MNKLTKIGVSALCGSLAAVSAANAGEMTVSGTVDLSWVSLDDEATGNPMGMGSNVSFTGTGEMDNGWGVKLAVDATNALAYSSANVTVTIPGLGAVLISQGLSGTGIMSMDDITPTAWEEAYGAGLTSGINNVAGGSAGAGIQITPTDLMPSGIATTFHWTPDADGKDNGDKSTTGGAVSTILGSGWDATITASGDATPDGLTLYGGYSSVDQFTNGTAVDDDITEWTAGIKYAVGSFTVGYQMSEEDNGRATTTTGYDNAGYGVVFAVNDDLSISYNVWESDQIATTTSTSLSTEASSFQIAYSAGGMSIRLAEQTVDNLKYCTNAANQRDATTVSVALAF
jgi:outer membrane protein OmpU